VWASGERIFHHGKADPHYVADPTSTAALDEIAQITGAPKVFAETDLHGVIRASRNAVGRAGTQAHIDAYARVALAPWFVLGGIAPLGFLLWRRNL
jgi:butyrate kinase